MEAALDLLGTVPLFERLDGHVLKRLDAITELTSAEEDDELTRQGEMPRYLHVLLEGQVVLSRDIAGRIIVPPGCVFGITAVGAGSSHVVQSTIAWEELPI